MICEKTHVTEASFMSLVREREELMQEVEVLRAQLAMARDGALEEAARVCDANEEEWDDGDYYDTQHIGARKCAEEIRALKTGAA